MRSVRTTFASFISKIADGISTMKIPREKLTDYEWMLENLRKLNPDHRRINEIEKALKQLLR